MSTLTLVAAVAVLLGAVVQSGLGFGMSIVAAPIVAATDGPALAAPTLTVVGLVTSGLLLVAEHRRPVALWGTVARLVAWALPGMVVGALLLRVVPSAGLSVLVALAVLLAVGLQARTLRPPAAADAAGPAATSGAAEVGRAPAGLHLEPVAGFTSGVLQTSTGLNGPPLVLHLVGLGTPAAQSRDTLAAVFWCASVLGVGVFLLTGTFRVADEVPVLIAAGVTGWLLGRLLVPVIARRHSTLALAVVAVGATAALVQVALAV